MAFSPESENPEALGGGTGELVSTDKYPDTLFCEACKLVEEYGYQLTEDSQYYSTRFVPIQWSMGNISRFFETAISYKRAAMEANDTLHLTIKMSGDNLKSVAIIPRGSVDQEAHTITALLRGRQHLITPDHHFASTFRDVLDQIARYL